ncbi:MAG: hypothetical protein ACT4OX_12720 [Actinomycetota bacterium]
MAPVLQCPDCSTRHPLDVAAEAAAFRCSGCGRVLKVPAQFRAAPGTSSPTGSPSGNGRAPSRHFDRAVAGAVPVSLRVLLWGVAVPVGFFVVFALATVFDVLTANQLEDVFLETGWGRFWPVGRLLPVIALLTAAIVHLSVIAISRWRVRHAVVRIRPHARDATAPEREPARRSS